LGSVERAGKSFGIARRGGKEDPKGCRVCRKACKDSHEELSEEDSGQEGGRQEDCCKKIDICRKKDGREKSRSREGSQEENPAKKPTGKKTTKSKR
jgi:hypothetical protein